MTDKQPGATEVQTATKEPRKRRNMLLWVLGPTLVLGIAGYVYVTSGRYVSTDNAYVQADYATIAPQISGRVVEVLVHDNQPVKAGDVLFRIDSQPLEIAMTRMQAQMETARGLLDAGRAGYRSAQADLTSADEALRVNERQLPARLQDDAAPGLAWLRRRTSTTQRTTTRTRAASAIPTSPR